MAVADAIVFGNSFEALLKHGLELPPGVAPELSKLGVDMSKPFLPAYPLSSWRNVLTVLVQECFPELEEPAAYEVLGRSVIVGLRQTAIGKAAHEKNMAVGIHRALERLTRGFRMSNNYVETTSVQLGPGDYQLTLTLVEELRAILDQAGLPPGIYYAGVFAETLEGWGAQDVSVSVVREDRERWVFEYRIRFRETAAAMS